MTDSGTYHKKKYDKKHEPGTTVQPAIRDAVISRAKEKTISCALAFSIAAELEVSPAEVGITLDVLNCRLTKCQMGLFGYAPEKKIVAPSPLVDADLSRAIHSALAKDRLPCKIAWEIADRFQMGKMVVSSACEALGIKIKPCQLGAF